MPNLDRTPAQTRTTSAQFSLFFAAWRLCIALSLVVSLVVSLVLCSAGLA